MSDDDDWLIGNDDDIDHESYLLVVVTSPFTGSLSIFWKAASPNWKIFPFVSIMIVLVW